MSGIVEKNGLSIARSFGFHAERFDSGVVLFTNSTDIALLANVRDGVIVDTSIDFYAAPETCSIDRAMAYAQEIMAASNLGKAIQGTILDMQNVVLVSTGQLEDMSIIQGRSQVEIDENYQPSSDVSEP